MRKLAILLTLAIPATAWAAATYIDTWPGIGQNRQLDALRCYALAFAPADQHRATYSCANNRCTARVTMPFLGGWSTLRLSTEAGNTAGEIVTDGGTKLADAYISTSSVFYVGAGAPGQTPLALCTYPRVAPVGVTARLYGNVF